MNTMSHKQRLKAVLLPGGRVMRTLPVGIGRGVRMEVDFMHHAQLFLGLYEWELNSHLRRLAVPGTRSFDVGGSFGYDALVLAKLTGARVCTIEMDDAAVERLRHNVDANAWADVEVVHAAVAATSDASGTSFTLDDLAYARADGFVPALVKIDIEGNELAALQGATELLRSAGPSLVVEVHSQALEDGCIDLVRSHGYPAPVVVNQRRFLREHRPLAHNRWLVWS
ncbi:MAG: hypothetical protein QOF40_1893 [Actinomycetota bacterium]|jgi:hypothetical protein|nr:hypothetical protein [Actinomycetota bacterium]